MEEKKIIRAPSLKRGKTEERITDRIKLEKVLGVTVSSNAALACDNTGTIAYPAGCTVVVLNTKTHEQHHIINVSRKTITSLAFSACGRYIVTGECGHQPAVRVWDLYTINDAANQVQQLCEFMGHHKYGVNCVSFSPNGKYIVSVGTQHDMIVNVWDWRNNIKVASNKVSTKVKSLAFAENGSYFVTVGNRHVKFWYLEYGGKSKYKEAVVPLMGRSAILGEQRNNYFCDVVCGKGTMQCCDSTYAITRSGLLCEFNNRRLLDKWVELRTTSANCITIGENFIFVGCADSIVRCFNPITLHFITTLPRTHYLGVDVALGTNIQHMTATTGTNQLKSLKYPDTIALTFNEANNKLTCIYNDHSIYVWDVLNIKRVGKSCSYLYHSACIWGVEIPFNYNTFPIGSFLTCSSDDTIRLWNLDKQTNTIYNENIYSSELLKIVYVDAELNFIKDLDLSSDKQQETSSFDGRNGVRCIRTSPNGKHLACGDRSGNIRIYDTTTMQELYKIEAHDAEVLCLEYSQNGALMASASRDRLLHVFDVIQNYEFRQTLDDHSSSITAVRFLNNNSQQMVSCGADKSLIFRSQQPNGFSREHIAIGKTTLYDMEIDVGQKHVITACQDRNVRIYSVGSGKHTRSFKGSCGDDGTLIKCVLDKSGLYLATSCTDKSLSIYDYYSGECMATMCGHSELATGLRFTNDCRHLISASGDGCIFVWRIPHDMIVTMHARLSQQAMRQGNKQSLLLDDGGGGDMLLSNYRFNIGQLPQWAKKQLTDDGIVTSATKTTGTGAVVAPPKGRWAQRAATVQFQFDGNNVKNKRDESDFESSTAHDGDIDSDQAEHSSSHNRIYYPQNIVSDSALSGSEFTVNNIDVEELRKSQRKKKITPIIQIQQQQQQRDSDVDFYDDYDDDDDAVSTPSGENTDRNPMSSLFSNSTESLDQLIVREKYLALTFENMSGSEQQQQQKNNSISSKFLTKNDDLIKAVVQTKSDPEAMKKRQLLNKRIAETKKKLESVGHSPSLSPLKYSQSIHDLSHITPERNKNKQVYLDESSPDNSLRRSCSLSDLSMQKPLVKKIDQASKKNMNNGNRRLSKNNNNNMTRSQSSTILNQQQQSDSDEERQRVSRLMRPTISSHNKINKNLTTTNIINRKKQSYSTSMCSIH